MTLAWSDYASQQLVELLHEIAADRPLAAERWYDGLSATLERLPLYPMSGRVVPEDPYGGIREVVYRSYRVFYHITDDRVIVVGIRHQRQLLQPGTITPPPQEP